MIFAIWLPKCLNWPFCPGVFIAILAVLAAAVTFRKEPRTWEKATWTLVFLGLMSLEVWMMSIDRDANEARERAAEQTQLKGFNAIGEGIKASISESNRNFVATIGKTNQILKNITGGDSFAYVAPQNFSGDQFAGVVWNKGDQALSGLTLTIAHTSDPIAVWGAAFFKPIFIGTIGPHGHAPIPDFLFQPRADEKTGQDNYWIMLSAQNGTVSQSVYFRRDRKNPQNWAYSFQVSKEAFLQKPQGKLPKGATVNTLLLYRGWSDEPPVTLPQPKPQS
jgi:hypothetical protein